MKKSLLSLAGIIALSSILCWAVSAQLEISDLFYDGTPQVDGAHSKLLNEYENTWWYADSTAISCEVNNGITITSSIVEDSTMDKANVYNLFFSPYRVEQIKSSDPSVDVSKIMMKKVEIGDSDSDVKFEIPSSEISSNTVYYGFISPADMFDVVGTPSKEICFNLDSNKCLQADECDTLKATNTVEPSDEVVEQHGASCVWMDLANVTHVVNGNTLTLKWSSIEGDVVEIAIFDPESEVYKSLWTAKMSDEKFDYNMQWDGEQNFMLTNWCKEVYYKADAKRWEEEPIKATPATGPAENILYVAIAAIVLYGAYVVFFRKSENN